MAKLKTTVRAQGWGCNWWEWMQPLWKTAGQFLKKSNIHLLHDPATPHLGICPRQRKTHVYANTCARMLTVAAFIVTENWNQPNCLSPSEWNTSMERALSDKHTQTGTTPGMLRERRPNREATKVWFHWYNTMETVKPQGPKTDHWLPRAGGGKGVDYKKHKVIRGRNCLIFWLWWKSYNFVHLPKLIQLYTKKDKFNWV